MSTRGWPTPGGAEQVSEAELSRLLHQAAIHDNVDLLGSLLQAAGCDVNARDDFGRTPLYTAVSNNSLQCARCLLQASADVDAAAGPKCCGMTALHKAAQSNQADFVSLLLNYGAEPSLADKDGCLALDLAANNDSDECIRLITREMELRHREVENIEIKLFEACLTADMGLVKELSSKMDAQAVKAAVNRMPSGNSSLLHRACADGNVDLVSFLAAHGSERLLHPVTGLSALHAACLSGSIPCVRVVLEHYPELVQAPTLDGMLPLHVAVDAGHEGVVSLLLRFPYPAGQLRLWRERGGGERVCRLGLDVNGKDAHGRTALHLACQAGHLAVAQRLLEFSVRLAGTASEAGLVAADATDGAGDALPAVHPAEIDLLDLEGNTPLHLVVRESDAARPGLLATAAALLHSGADPNRPLISASGNRSCLMEACCKRDVAMLRLLLTEGATDAGDAVLALAITQQNDALIAPLLCRKSHVDADHKVNHYEVREWLKGAGRPAPRTLWPARPVVISWPGLALPSVSPHWLCEAAVHHNPAPPHPDPALPLYALTRLDVSDNGLAMLPQDVFLLPSLRSLDASNNRIRWLPGCELPGQAGVLPTAAWHCPLLQELLLQDNQLADLPVDVFALPSLRKLSVSHNQLTSLPGELWTSESLRHLNASHNLLTVLPCPAGDSADGAVAIAGGGGRGAEGPPGASWASTPKRGAFAVAGSVGSPLATRREQLSDREGEDVAEELAVQYVQPWAGRLSVHAAPPDRQDEAGGGGGQSHLEELNLAANRLTALPAGLPCLAPRLLKLDLSRNQLREVGGPNGYPAGLRSLNLSHNLIASESGGGDTPQTNGHPPRACLSPWAHSKQATSLIRSPSGGGLGHSRSSSLCSVRSQCLTAAVNGCVHVTHRCLARLHTLRLDHNRLGEVTLGQADRPDGGGDVRQTLQWSDSDSVGSCHSVAGGDGTVSKENVTMLYPNLTILDVSHNGLSVLNSLVGELSQLAELKLAENRLKELPLSLGGLRKLWNLSLDGCPVQKTLQALLGEKARKTSAVLGYLKSVDDEAVLYNHMKLMFVGVESIGKTSLLMELRKEGRPDASDKTKNWAQRMGEEGQKDKDVKGQNISTVGVDIGKLVLQRANRSVVFSTWDFAGQREYYATHQYFLSNRSIYLILWRLTDGEKGVNEILQWLVNIQARAPNAPVIIVGTHLDLITKKKYPATFVADLQQLVYDKYMSHEEPEKSGLPRVIGRIAVSCRARLMHNSHVTELAAMIWDVAVNEPLPGNQGARLLEQKVPASYVHLQEIVGQLAEEQRQLGHCPMLHSDLYRSLATQRMEEVYHRPFRDVAELNQATNFLHENGVLLHYNDVNLQDIYFLDPQWLCDVLANVVTIREVNSLAKCGTMRTDDLCLLFKNSLSFETEDLKTYIIDLLNKFEVALLWDGCNLLIPSLLPTEHDIQSGRPGADIRIPAKVSEPESVSGVDALVGPPPTQPVSLVSPPSTQPIVPPVIPPVTSPVTSPVSLLRLYLMSYFPSGFWPRLITRLLADPRFSCLSGRLYGSAAVSTWRCWQTGVELLRAGVPVLRVKQAVSDVSPARTACDYARAQLLLGGADVQWRPIDVHNLALLEILVPNASLHTPGGATVQPDAAAAAGLLARLVAHVDTLLEDWYPDLGTRFMQNSRGLYLITRLVPCARCVVREADRQEQQLQAGWAVVDVREGDRAEVTGPAAVCPDAQPDARPEGWVDSIYSRGRQAVGSVYDIAASSTGLLPHWDSNSVFTFTLESCMLGGDADDASEPRQCCPLHGPVGLHDSGAGATPDVVFQDIDESYLVSGDHLTRGRFLGKGAFGAVYAGTMIDKKTGEEVDVAMKMMQPVDPGKNADKSLLQAYQVERARWRKEPQKSACEAYLNVRQELGVLLTLHHPHIVSLLGLSQRPLCLLLPLAPLGALRDRLLEYQRADVALAPVVVRHIVLQVASALEYLHSLPIIYRDLKSENVLVWSLPAPGGPAPSPVDVRLSDYGVSRAVLPSGAKGLAGTVPFIAPEIIQHNGEEPYTEKVDCFSFGMFLYELLLCKLPFEKAGSSAVGANIKGHVMVGGRPAITQRELSTPTHLLDLMTRCWASDPADRPSARQIAAVAARPELSHLVNVVRVDARDAAVSVACAVPCWRNLALDGSTAGSVSVLEDAWPCTEVWLASHRDQTTHLQVYTYHDNECVHAKRLHVALPPLTCMCVTDQDVWCADDTATIHIFSQQDSSELLSFRAVHKTGLRVTCMAYGRPEGQVYVILNDGRFVICRVDVGGGSGDGGGVAADYSPVKTECPGNGRLIHCMAALSRTRTFSELWCGQTGGCMSIWNLDSDKGSLRRVTHPPNTPGGKAGGDVTHVVTADDGSAVWSYVYPGSVVYQWGCVGRQPSGQLDLLPLIRGQRGEKASGLHNTAINPPSPAPDVGDCHVTAMAVANRQLYVGTTLGVVVVVDAVAMMPLAAARCHSDLPPQVGCILPLVRPGRGAGGTAGGCGGVVTLGRGYRDMLAMELGRGETTHDDDTHIICWLASDWHCSAT